MSTSTLHSWRPPMSGGAMAVPTRRTYRAARAFYLTLFIVTCLATYAILQHRYHPPPGPSVYRRHEVSVSLKDDEECRLVHRASDQCAFIKKHCPNEEAGFSAYLHLFYCKLPHVKPVAFILLISWLGLLFSTIGIAASDFFCINLSTIASLLGLSESMAGVTFLAFGNGSPDVFSTFAAMNTNSGNLAVGELFGAAGFITAVVAGSMALIRPFHVARKSFVRDVGFFVIATAFSIGFLADGKLHLWECISMVAFYIFYVVFVVVWHWWLGRRRRKRENEAAARGHFVPPSDELHTEPEEYHDDPGEGADLRPSVSRGVSREDWSALENGVNHGPYMVDIDEAQEEAERDRWMSELSSNMRLTRPARSRRNTINPVRPSLVGALEFQAVLKSLQKSRNIQTIPLDSRRYSDDPSFTTVQQQDQLSSLSDPASRPLYEVTVTDNGTPTVERPGLEVPKSAPGRTRAVSANDASSMRLDPDLQRTPLSSSPETLIDVADHVEQQKTEPSLFLDVPKRGGGSPQSPSIEISPATPKPETPLRPDTFRSGQPSTHSTERLATPDQSGMFRRSGDLFSHRAALRKIDSPQESPRSVPAAHGLPKISIPRRDGSGSRGATPMSSPRVRYHDSTDTYPRPPSLYLPLPVQPQETLPALQENDEQTTSKRLLAWWPRSILPPPGVIIAALFPTIYHWHEKSWWEKCLGIVAAPSVFLLTITLPVMENDKEREKGETRANDLTMDSTRSKSISGAPGQTAAVLNGVVPEDAAESVHPGTHRHSLATPIPGGGGTLAAHTEQQQRQNFIEGAPHLHASAAAGQPTMVSSPSPTAESDGSHGPELWNRWLTIIQLFLAPDFVVLSIYTQSPSDIEPRWLIRPMLICLLVSLTLLVPLLATTTPTHRPAAFHTILSLAGFIVSIAWISTVASQVVGALKALAVILNMSHAIMGLTIFAVGNSLGDLVADVTVAKLGYPVMALSACFGGPMLNILLGIGLSGSYILIRGAHNRHEQHPGKGYKFKAYHIEVSNTLIVSGATLLVTLVGLLIVVPMNKWVLSRRIGWALIVLWTLSTVGNVVLEVTGWVEAPSED